MTKELSQLITSAPHKSEGLALMLMLVPTGDYDGFWGYNGFQNITVLWTDGQRKPDTNDFEWYIAGELHDIVRIDINRVDNINAIIPHNSMMIDFDNRYLVPRIRFLSPISFEDLNVAEFVGTTSIPK